MGTRFVTKIRFAKPPNTKPPFVNSQRAVVRGHGGRHEAICGSAPNVRPEDSAVGEDELLKALVAVVGAEDLRDPGQHEGQDEDDAQRVPSAAPGLQIPMDALGVVRVIHHQREEDDDPLHVAARQRQQTKHHRGHATK